MSSKPSTSKKADHIKPNTVLTRHKSAQMKRQLRNKDESIRRISQITQLLRSPAKDKSTKSPKALKKNAKSPEKKVKKRDEEFLPDKLKRKIKRKKVVLKPKIKLKKIGSKRKLAVPHKGISFPAAKSPSLAELMALADAELGEEDLMEILTCESPVWWEDPPHHDYNEDPIYNMIPSPAEDIKQCNSQVFKSPTKTPESSIDLPNVRLSDDRFIKKRTKLEHLLGNIKKNLNTTQDKGKKEIDMTDKEDTNEIEAKEIKIETGNDEDELIEKGKDENIETNISEDKDTSATSKRDKSNSECTEYAFITDDIIKDLENMDIPIESGIHHDYPADEDDKNVNTTDPIKDLKADVIEKKDSAIENTDEVSNEIVSDVKMKNLDESKELVHDKVNTFEENKKMDYVNQISAEEEKKLNETIKMYFVDAVSEGVMCEKSDVKSASPSKAKFSITSIEVTSPLSIRSMSDDTADTTSLVSNCDLDTISDTNIKYIDDSKASEAKKDEKNNTESKIEGSIEKSKDVNEKKIFLKQVGTTNEGKNSKPKINREQLMTVYKIITNDEYRESYLKNIENGSDKSKLCKVNPENVDTENTTSLDTFFRKCKHNHQKRKKMEILNQILDKHKISDSEPKSSRNDEISSVCERQDPEKTALNIISDVKSAKYCLKCSSIFETETCSYCIKKGQASEIGCHTCKVIS